MEDFSTTQLSISTKREVKELGYTTRYYILQNRSGYEIQSIDIRLVYHVSSSGYISGNGSFTSSPGFHDEKTINLLNIMPGESREFSLKGDDLRGWYVANFKGILADSREFTRDFPYNNPVYNVYLLCCGGTIFFIYISWWILSFLFTPR